LTGEWAPDRQTTPPYGQIPAADENRGTLTGSSIGQTLQAEGVNMFELPRPRRPRAPSMVLGACFLAFACAAPASAQTTAAAAPLPALTIEDLYSESNIVDVDISPSGKTLAAVVRRDSEDVIISVELATGEKKLVTRINKDAFGDQIDVRIGFVAWKTESRLLFQLQSDANEGLDYSRLSRSNVLKLGNRLYAVDRDGKNPIPMLGEQYNEAMVGAFDTSDVASMLWRDPKHILLRIGGWDGRSLFKVDVDTGRGKVVEPQKASIIDWWLDVDGKAIGRVEYSAGTLRYYRRLEDGKWKKYHSVRRRDMEEQPDFIDIGPSDDPTKFYVLARPPGKDRMGVYLYDLSNESFGDPLIENTRFDVQYARASDDGKRIVYHCYDEHTRICEFGDPKMSAYMRGLRKFFDQSANVYVVDASEDSSIILLSVDGPVDAPAFYYYLVDKQKIEFVGLRQGALGKKKLASASLVNYKARDGVELTGYLTYPPGAKDARKLPLVLMPHGGPQVRDRLEFDPWVQYFAARGYAVFQPNFRGSGGFGQAFEFSGHREWGRKMQDDLGDGVKALVDQGIVDADRVCIVGASYGGYAALAGATLTPTAYKCAVSLAGIADLEEFVRWKKKKFGDDSDVYAHWVRAIGDPEKDQAYIRAVSPAHHVDAIRIPILLIHGVEDESVPISQSEDMQKLLDKSGRKTVLLRLENEGHGGFGENTSKVMLTTIGDFLWKHLGKGHGVSEAPTLYVFKK
jgi:dipeptidyl aminopeptidase/acylaminoacyl peptidase